MIITIVIMFGSISEGTKVQDETIDNMRCYDDQICIVRVSI